ncbi:efflux RND transporter periplasmic adaptor subunit [Brevibacillus sp. TJ4]|uniref:efflux RND transporter periplasmic adaptor subunit n=1 Tax=Brevibacillus sp. TJ4 TaxID=3234853 RepID=UPI0037D7A6CD
MNKKKWIIIALAAVVLGGGGYAGYQGFFASKPDADDTFMEEPAYPTAAVELGDVTQTIFAPGTVEAKAREEVRPEVSGKVERLLVQEGQTVSKGDVLFTLDGTDDMLEIEKLELAITRAEKDLDELKQKKDRIIATEEGKVTEVLVRKGDTVTPESIVAKLMVTGYLKITGKFSAYEADQFRVGQKVKVFITSTLSYVEGTVIKIDTTGKKELGLGGEHDIEVLVKNPGALYAGDLGEVQYTDEKGLFYGSQIRMPFEFPDEIEVKAGTHGIVDSVNIEKDDLVTIGQELIRMDMTTAGLELREKELSLMEAKLTLEQKRRDIAKKRVVAPIGGVITKLNVKEGETPTGSEPAAIIMDTSTVYFVAAVDEMDIPKIAMGQQVDVYLTAFGNEFFQGKVVELPKEGTVEDKDVRFQVKVELSEASQMKHGMTGDCDIYVAHKEGVKRLPLNAVEILEAGKGSVMVKDPASGEMMPKEVEIGVEGTDFVEIVDGLDEGEEVMVMGGGMY